MHLFSIKTIIKNSAKSTIGIITKPISKYYINQIKGITIFAFHDITNRPSPFVKQFGLFVSLDTFNQQILWINQNFNVIHPFELIEKTSLPPCAALITFDDGFLGSFNNGLNILRKHKLPAIMFVNMRAIMEKQPILSSVACYLEKYVPDFLDFANSKGLSRPFHLTLNPKYLTLFQEEFGELDLNAIHQYQGDFADINVIKEWNNSDYIVYGNHLFDHWNASSLNDKEFDEQYRKNESALSHLDNWINFFAFTNGQPNSCFSDKHITRLRQLGARKIFSSSGCYNREVNQYLNDRLSLSEYDKYEDYCWFRLANGIRRTF